MIVGRKQSQPQPQPLDPTDSQYHPRWNQLGLLDGPAESGLVDLARLAAYVCGTQMAGVSLVTAEGVWLPARHGLDLRFVSLEQSFCPYALEGRFMVPDARLDPRFTSLQLVSGPMQVRFFASVPVGLPDGPPLGTLFVLDRTPGELTEVQFDALAALGRQVSALMALHQRTAELARMTALLDLAHDAVCVVANDNSITYWNDGATAMYGFTREEAVGACAKDLLKTRFPVDFETTRGDLIRDGRWQGELTHTARDGRQIVVQSRWALQRTPEGQPSAALIINTDVTRRKMVELQNTRYQQQNALYAEIVRHMRIGLYAYRLETPGDDRTLRMIATNPAAESFTGVPMEAVMGRTIDEAFPGLRETGLPRQFADVIRTGTPIHLGDFPYGDGRVGQASFSIDAFPIPPNQVGVTFDNVTERKRAEQALLESEQRFRALFEAAADGILTLGGEGRLESMNPAAERMFGCHAKDLVGQPASLLVPELANLAEGGPVLGRVTESRGLRLDGGNVPVELSVTAFEFSDPTNHRQGRRLYAAMVRDITQRKEIERLKSEFISTVSHELRTPLTSIRGALGLIEGGIAGALPSMAIEMVQIARQNADRLVRLINDILDLEKMEAGKLVLRLQDVGPEHLVAQTLDSMRAVAAEAGVRLQSALNLRENIRGDEDRIVQVLTNLLGNAVKFSPAGSVVTVRAAMAAGQRARFEVSDQGPGIPQAQMGRLFGKFQQLDASDGRLNGGTGLGLAISKAIVERHGGTIGVESEPGVGSTFWFELPLQEATEPQVGTPRQVLVVEDDLAVAGLLIRLVEGEGLTASHACNLKQAQEMLVNLVPAAVLLDVNLPDGTGLDVLEMMRLSPAMKDVAVIAITGEASQHDEVGRRGVYPVLIDWLQTPFDTAQLRSTLRRATSTRRGLLGRGLAGEPGSAPPRVLLVDDDASLRTVLATRLRAMGAECVEASDGAAAIQLAREQCPDLVVLDVSMPRPDGFEVVDILRREAAQATPLLVYTGMELEPEARARLTLGRTRLLTKARASEDEFIDAVRALLAGVAEPE